MPHCKMSATLTFHAGLEQMCPQASFVPLHPSPSSKADAGTTEVRDPFGKGWLAHFGVSPPYEAGWAIRESERQPEEWTAHCPRCVREMHLGHLISAHEDCKETLNMTPAEGSRWQEASGWGRHSEQLQNSHGHCWGICSWRFLHRRMCPSSLFRREKKSAPLTGHLS